MLRRGCLHPLRIGRTESDLDLMFLEVLGSFEPLNREYTLARRMGRQEPSWRGSGMNVHPAIADGSQRQAARMEFDHPAPTPHPHEPRGAADEVDVQAPFVSEDRALCQPAKDPGAKIKRSGKSMHIPTGRAIWSESDVQRYRPATEHVVQAHGMAHTLITPLRCHQSRSVHVEGPATASGPTHLLRRGSWPPSLRPPPTGCGCLRQVCERLPGRP